MGIHPDTRDETLVERAQDGDTGAFEELVRRHQDTVFRIALRTLDDHGEAADAAQEALITAWRKLPDLGDARTFRAWLYRIAHRRALNIIRARRATAAIDDEAAVPDPASGPEHQSMASSLRAALDTALAGLPPPQRTCWILRELEGLGYEEIAEIVDATPTAVRGRIHRARTQLVEALEPWR
ncbi:RNA polymerase ECF family sigma subunit [Murinocardiopsis flavida]|uniref:RNA polymerase ECF family sigma subunit n=1 Tax=Murinocardiopsis flavida TaxID=645275 RepID=A0A2P8DF59_9ACTN|nr:sigma-70 family RNA polymerase sigma factor [Murinocardiopsis flavida]PSK95856.1 RNA polymerase ECF family sigma subunit [Murinocardiopsis flavida]